MLRQSGIKYNHIIAMLLMAVVIFMPFGGRGVTVNARSDLAVKSVMVASPCQQSKVNQSAFSNFCQSQAGAAHLYCLLSDFVTFRASRPAAPVPACEGGRPDRSGLCSGSHRIGRSASCQPHSEQWRHTPA